jgi:transcriptional regulator with XRE-family HTH domain
VTEATVESARLAPGYGDIHAAQNVGDDLEVTFENGDVIRISPSTLGVSGTFEVVEAGDLGSAGVRLTTSAGVRDISWLQLRVATDPGFARQMREEDTNEARRVAHRLKALREDRGLSQRDVAALADMTSPQLSKIESGAFDLRVSTVQALLRAMGATLADISLPGTPEVSQKAMRKRADDAGVGRDLVDRFVHAASRIQVPQLIERGFGWTTDALAAGQKPPAPLAAAVQFKTATHAGAPQDSPLLTLSGVVADVVRIHTQLVAAPSRLPAAAELRARLLDEDGRVTLLSMIEWMWDHGIPVIPLYGKGGFCAAVLATDEGPVVIIKEIRDHMAYWMFDVAHEIGHIALGHVDDYGLVDVDSPTPGDQETQDAQEKAANAYALELLLGRPDELIRRVDIESQGSYLRFKGAVATVARQENVNAGLLGVVAAKVLTHVGEGKDRWGSANNLSLADGPPRPVAQAALERRLIAGIEPELDAILFRAAVLSD